jgi:hypothetical protein
VWKSSARIAAATFVIAASVLGLAENGQAATSPPGFQTTAAAYGVQLNASLPGAPLSSSPLGSGGPSGQAALNSLGTGTGYAAFPDPGELVQSLPGLAAGLLAGGAAGLPPIHLPALPSYPFAVTATATNPSQAIGAGAYRIVASTNAAESKGLAVTGLQLSGAGNTALVASSSDVKVHGDGSVTSTATSDIQGLTLGPVTIGEITSTATESLSPDGIVTPSTSISVTGLRIGTLAVSLDTKGLNIAGNSVPVPVDGLINSLLKSQHITVSTLKAQSGPGLIVSPAVQITGPLPTKKLGTAKGTFTLLLGMSTASMVATGPSAATTGDVGSSGSTGSLGTGGTPGSLGSGGGPSDIPPLGGSSSLEPTTQPPSVAPGQGQPSALAPAAYLGTFDIRNLYLLLCIVGAGAFLVAQLVRLIGVRGPWTSTGG